MATENKENIEEYDKNIPPIPLFKDDATPDITDADGLGIGINDDLAILFRSTRCVNEKDRFSEYTKTLFKATPGKSKNVGESGGEVPLP